MSMIQSEMTRTAERVERGARTGFNVKMPQVLTLRRLREEVRAKIQDISASENIPESDPKSQLLRPMLAYMIARELKLPLEHKNFAMAMTASQVIHEASLYHDDVIDEGKYRRGKPTFPSQVGNRIAVMQGDRFIAAAFKLIAESEAPLLMKDFVYTIEKIINGEVLQNAEMGKMVSWKRYQQINQMKTGELFAFAARIPYYFVTTEDKARMKVLSRLALSIGTFYQYLDDFFDYNLFSDSGKPSYQDFKAKKWTLIPHFVKDFSWNGTLTDFWKANYGLEWAPGTEAVTETVDPSMHQGTAERMSTQEMGGESKSANETEVINGLEVMSEQPESAHEWAPNTVPAVAPNIAPKKASQVTSTAANGTASDTASNIANQPNELRTKPTWDQLELCSPLQEAAEFLIKELTALQFLIRQEFTDAQSLLELIDIWKAKVSQAQADESSECLSAVKQAVTEHNASKKGGKSTEQAPIPSMATLHKFLYAFLERTVRAKEQAASARH